EPHRHGRRAGAARPEGYRQRDGRGARGPEGGRLRQVPGLRRHDSPLVTIGALVADDDSVEHQRTGAGDRAHRPQTAWAATRVLTSDRLPCGTVPAARWLGRQMALEREAAAQPEVERDARVEQQLAPAARPRPDEAGRLDAAQRQHLVLVEVVEEAEQLQQPDLVARRAVAHALADREVREQISADAVAEDRGLGVELDRVRRVAVGVDQARLAVP